MSGINRWAIYSSTFPQIFYWFLKDPGPLTLSLAARAGKKLLIFNLSYHVWCKVLNF